MPFVILPTHTHKTFAVCRFICPFSLCFCPSVNSYILVGSFFAVSSFVYSVNESIYFELKNPQIYFLTTEEHLDNNNDNNITNSTIKMKQKKSWMWKTDLVLGGVRFVCLEICSKLQLIKPEEQNNTRKENHISFNQSLNNVFLSSKSVSFRFVYIRRMVACILVRFCVWCVEISGVCKFFINYHN